MEFLSQSTKFTSWPASDRKLPIDSWKFLTRRLMEEDNESSILQSAGELAAEIFANS